jgi:hypothetical protein
MEEVSSIHEDRERVLSAGRRYRADGMPYANADLSSIPGCSMNDAPQKRGSFWTSLPGILAGIGGVITAVGAILGLLAANHMWPFVPQPEPAQPRLGMVASQLSYKFDPVQQGKASDSYAITVTNPRTDPVSLTVALAGDNANSFDIKQETCSVGPVTPKGTCVVELVFSPQAQGPLVARVVVSPSDGDGAAQIALSGNGLAAGELSFSPAIVKQAIYTVIGPVKPNTATDVIITNTGLARVTITAVKVSDTTHFSANTACNGRALNPEQTCTVTVTFAPTADGTFNATLQVYDDGPGSPHTVNITAYRGPPTLIKIPTGRPPIVSPRPAATG